MILAMSKSHFSLDGYFQTERHHLMKYLSQKKNNPNDIHIPFGLSVFYQVEFLIRISNYLLALKFFAASITASKAGFLSAMSVPKSNGERSDLQDVLSVNPQITIAGGINVVV